MLETLTHCPVCQSTDLQFAMECEDHMLSNESFKLLKCGECHTLITNPRPDEKSIVNYYKSDSYISHTNKSKGIINRIYKVVRGITLRSKYKVVSRYALQGTHLDYGCGTGHFLEYMTKKGWSSTGIEPDKDARAIANQINPQPVLGRLDELDAGTQFNAITLFHVLEHVHQLNETLERLVKHLKQSGILIIAVPNYRSADALHYGKHWAAYDVPRHLYHFSQESLNRISENHGLKIVSIFPMKFDSYYVSMLSETYRNGKNNYLSAFKMGFRSNRQARKTKEYSSLLYVLSKK